MARKGRVEGRVALITGVAKQDSIGFATAKVFAAEGALLAICDIAEAVHERMAELRELGATVSSHTADLTKMDQVRAMVAEVVECHGRIDVLVNNAGMVVFGQEEDFTAFQDLSEEAWDFGIAINLKSQFDVTRTVVPGMIERGYGRIVNMSSVTGPVVANPDEAAYCAAKAGVLGMTRGLAAGSRSQQRRGEQQKILAPQTILGFRQRSFQRLAKLVFPRDLMKLLTNRGRALGGQQFQRLRNRQPGPDRTGEHHHGVGQLVLDLATPLSQPAHQIPRPGGQKKGDQRG